MPDISPTLPTVGELCSTADPKILTALSTLVSTINALDSDNITDFALDADTLAAAVAQYLGVSQTGAVRRGKSIIATSEARSNTAYGTLTTPDQVSSVVLPTDGLLFVAYQALWQNSVAGAGRAAIFLGANQLKSDPGGSGGVPTVQEASGSSTVNVDGPLSSETNGLAGGGGTDASTQVTTGQVFAVTTSTGRGGVTALFAAAGTYDVSVQFRATSGSVTAKERRLWVWSMGF